MNTDPRRHQPADRQELAELLPAPGRPVLPEDRHRALREHLMEHITQENAPVRPHRWRRPALVAAPLALAAVLSLSVVAVDSVRDGRTGTSTAAGGATTEAATAPARLSAPRLLDRIALAAAARPAVTVRDDQYVYTRSQGSSEIWGGPTEYVRDAKGEITGTKVYQGDIQSEDWAPVDGTRDGLRRMTALTSGGQLDRSRTEDMAMQGTGYLTYRQLEALPTDPDKLLEELKGGGGVLPSRLTETIFENVGVILDSATLLPDLSAALYRTVAELPGVRVVDHVKDGAGRPGIGLTYTSTRGDAVATWVFDTDTLAYLGTLDSALLEVGVTDELRQAPDA